LQEEISGGVIAVLNCGGAQFTQRHATFRQMLSGDGSIFEQICLAIGNQSVKTLLFLVALSKNGGGSKEFKCAADRKAFRGAIFEMSAGGRVQRCDSQPTTHSLFDARKALNL
jgi:hypothetical protein